VNEKLNYTKSGNLVFTEFSVEKSGIYSIIAYGEKNGEKYEFKRDVALKSLSDKSLTVYHGSVKMSGEENFALFFENNKIIVPSDEFVKVTLPTENAEYVSLFCNDRFLPVERFSDRAEFTISKKGIYRIIENKNIKYPKINEVIKKSILLSKESLDLGKEEASLFDKSGRLIAKSEEHIIYFENIPAGVYFVKSEKILWKITKLF